MSTASTASRASSSEPDTFREMWGYPNEVVKTIPGAARFEVHPVPGAYKSGRPRFEATFVTADHKKVLARRAAMELVSKRTGKAYHVCRRQEDSKAANALQALAEAGFGIDDVIRGN